MKPNAILPRLLKPAFPALTACACLLAAGCSERDAALAEKVSAAEAAADRAEAAAQRAEAAARNADSPGFVRAHSSEIDDAEPAIEDPAQQDDLPPPAPGAAN